MNWEFWGEHWFLAWSALWLLWGIIWLPVALVSVAAKLINRVFRTINVACRGWPPAHLDSDGDWKPTPKQEDSKT